MRREGVESFDSCDVKVVKMITHGYPPDVKLQTASSTSIIPVDAADYAKKKAKDAPLIYGGHLAVLDCPYTQDTGEKISSAFNNHNGVAAAYDSVRENAGLIACRTCRFSGMTPAEVSIDRKEFAQAETERLRAYEGLEQARVELGIIEPPAPPAALEQ